MKLGKSKPGRAPSIVLLAAIALLPAHVAAQSARDPVPLPNVSQISQPGSTAPVIITSEPVKPEIAGSDSVSIGGRGAVNGAATINGVAGVNNMQANVGVVANGQHALASGNVAQISRPDGLSGGNHAHAAVAAGALAGSSGWLAVAGAAGADNQQVNLAIMAFGIEGLVVTDLTLAQTRASTKPMGENGAADASPSRSVAIGQGAFKESSGVVQLTLVGGDRNASANTFALLVAGIAKPE
jgi:hypothetical protein